MSYKAWKGNILRDLSHFHDTIKWNAKLDAAIKYPEYGPWIPTIKNSTKSPDKRKAVNDGRVDESKKAKTLGKCKARKADDTPPINQHILATSPISLIWDSTNHSCAYDAFFTSMAHIWRDDPAGWTQHLIRSSILLGVWGLLMTEQPDPPEQQRRGAPLVTLPKPRSLPFRS
ncbi:hypothetical protein B0H17DRAFT_1128544 [Mycena rosella]|uniref:Uncharacterized protein n=1 Tax=Mycena rosella TaxID=1033263 RepID=A0AAD7GLI9_MYCRO|nr:hypothetical protein B0H17DRAFT_1128544 [Mycena rosella]